MAFLRNLVEVTVFVLWLLVVGRVVVSWFDPTARNTASRYVVALTEPMLAPIRRVLPPTGMFDLSPLILMIVLGTVLGLVGR